MIACKQHLTGTRVIVMSTIVHMVLTAAGRELSETALLHGHRAPELDASASLSEVLFPSLAAVTEAIAALVPRTGPASQKNGCAARMNAQPSRLL